MSDITADRLADVYMKIKAKRAEIAEAYEAEDAKLKEKMELVTAELLRICKETGADSIKTKHGTISRVVSEKYWVGDWGPYLDYIREHNAVHLFERRVAQSAMKEWLKDHPDDFPPSLNSDRKYEVRIYKPRKEIS